MVNPGICRRCNNCSQFVGVGRDSEDRLDHTPLIDCDVEGVVIVPSSEIPNGCPYRLEHLLVEEETSDLVRGWEEEIQGT